MQINTPATRLATRLSFLVAGFGIACWAPLVPFVKQRLGIDDGTLGLLLLCLGIGSIVAMLLAGLLSARFGSKPVIVAGGLGLALVLPLLSVVTSPQALGAALFAFGMSLGAIDVAMNVHAVEVEQASDKPLMSGFHALFSVGGFLGAGLVTLILSLGVSPLITCLMCALLMLVAIALYWPRLLNNAPDGDSPILARPKGIVLLLAILAGIMFLVEGAVLDWSALLITERGQVAATQGGLGYMLFAIAMTLGRFAGDTISARVGDAAILLWGGLTALAGFVVLLLAPIHLVALSGFLLIGLGASNIVPVLFRRVGSQTVMPPALAVAAISTVGYAGILVGPAGIGLLANAVGLANAFWLLAGLLCLVPLCAFQVARKPKS